MITMKSSKNHTDKSDSVPNLEKSMHSPKHVLQTMSTCIDSHFLLLVVSMGFVFYCITQEHTVNTVYVFHQTKADSDIPLYSTDSYYKRNISIIIDSNKPRIDNIETEYFWRRFVRRQKRLSENATNVERMTYLCFKTDQNLRYCVNLTKDANQNIILSMRIIINTENGYVEGNNNTNSVDNRSNTNTSNDPTFIEGLKRPISMMGNETFENKEPSFEPKVDTNENATNDTNNNDTRAAVTPVLELRKTIDEQLRMTVENFRNGFLSTETKADPNVQHDKDGVEMNRDRLEDKKFPFERVFIVNEPKFIYRDQKKMRIPSQARQSVYEISTQETRHEKRNGTIKRFNERIGSKRREETITHRSQYNNEESKSMKQPKYYTGETGDRLHEPKYNIEGTSYQRNYKPENRQQQHKNDNNPEESMQQPKRNQAHKQRLQQTRYNMRTVRRRNKVSQDRENNRFGFVKTRYPDQPDEHLERAWTQKKIKFSDYYRQKHPEPSVKYNMPNQKDYSGEDDGDDPDFEEMEELDKEGMKEIQNIMNHLNKYDIPNKPLKAVENSLIDVEELYEKDQILATLKNGKKKTVMVKDNEFKDNESEKYDNRKYHNNKHEYEEPDALKNKINPPNEQRTDMKNRRYHNGKHEYEEPNALKNTNNPPKEKEEDINTRRYHNNEYEEPDTLQDTINAPKEQEANIKNRKYYNNKNEYRKPDALQDTLNASEEQGVDIKNKFHNNKQKYEPDVHHEDPINIPKSEDETTNRAYNTNYQEPKTKNQKHTDAKEDLIKRIVEEFKNNFIAKLTQNKTQGVILSPPQINPPQIGTTTQRKSQIELNEKIQTKEETNDDIDTNDEIQQVEPDDKEPDIKEDNEYDDEIPIEQRNKQIGAGYDEGIHNIPNNRGRFHEKLPIDSAEYEERRPNDGEDYEERRPKIDTSIQYKSPIGYQERLPIDASIEDKEPNGYKEGFRMEDKLPPGEYVNLNQGYFQKSPKTWESLDSVYHIRDNR